MGFFLSKGFDPKDLPDLAGKVILVTGGNSGIGYAALQHLARRGAKVYMGARNPDRAKAAIERMQAEGLGPGNGQVLYVNVDFTELTVAKQSAENFMQLETRLLVPYAKSHNDIQDIVMVNYLSPTTFIRTLMPLLKQTAAEPNSDVRIVEVSSDGHETVAKTVRFRNIDDFNVSLGASDPMLARHLRYCLSKLMGILHMKELQRRLDSEGVPIIVLSVHPGIVNTEGVQAFAHSVGPILLIARACFSSPTEGGYSPSFAAAAPVVCAEAEKCRGAHIVPPGKLGRASALAEDHELAKELWDTTEKILQDNGMQ
ncbi:NAD-P-binding protein [Sparassis latifolia]